MAIPLKYNARNLRVRWRTAGLTAVGLGLVTTVFLFMSALGTGLERTMVSSGHPLNMIVLRPGATETQSELTRQQAADITGREGILKGADGEPLASAELVVVANILNRNGKKANIAIRGVGPRARDLREGFKVIEGRWFNPALGEVVVGIGARGRFANLAVGDAPFIRGRRWKVVGVFEASGQAYESEIWGDVADIQAEFKRQYSTLIARCADAATIERLGRSLKEDKQIQLEGRNHVDYFKDQNMSAGMLKAMGAIMAVVLSIGAVFGAANTMYASVASRSREIATMRVLGFSPGAIWLSFMIESAVLGVAGGVIGSLAARIIFNGMTTGSINWQTFSDVAFQFRVTPDLMLTGVILSTTTAILGGLFPAVRASRTTIAAALRGM